MSPSGPSRPKRKKAPDPGSLCRDLCAAAEADELRGLLLLLPPTRGEEEVWFAERILESIRKSLQRREDLDVLEVDGGSPDFTPDTVENFLQAPSLFSSGRALVFSRAAKALQKWPRLMEALVSTARERQAAEQGGGVQLLAVHTAGSLGRKLSAPKGKGIRIERFRKLYADPPPWRPEPDASEAAQFVIQEARRLRIRFESGAAGLFVQVAGARPPQLMQGLQHFVMLGIDTIDEEQVREVVARSAEGNAFEFAEAVLIGDGRSALNKLQSMNHSGLRTWDGRRLNPQEAVHLLLSVIAGERRRTQAVVDHVECGLDIVAACKEAGVPAGGPPAQRMQKRVRAVKSEDLQRLLQDLRTTEVRLKRGGWRNGMHAMEWMVLRALRRARRQPVGG